MRLFIFSILLVMTASVAIAQNPPQAANAAPKGDAENGKKLYLTHGCYQCHNYSAIGSGAGPRLAPRPMLWPAFVKQVRTPRDEMPPYSAKLMSDQELSDVYAYLATIPAPPAVDSIPLLKP